MTVVAITNQKGGTGKTTTAVNLGGALGEMGRRVLLVDLDPQANLTLHAGLRPEQQERTIWDALQLAGEAKPATLEQEDLRALLDSLWESTSLSASQMPIVERPNDNPFDIVPSSLELSEADFALVSAVDRERRLAAALAPVRDSHSYDYILIDCPPHLGILTLNAMAAADQVLIPLEASFLATKGMNQIFRVILKVKQSLNPRLGILGVLIAQVDQRTTHSKQIASEAREALGKRVRVFEAEIPTNVELADASAAGQCVMLYASRSSGAKAYRDLAKEVEDIFSGQKTN